MTHATPFETLLALILVGPVLYYIRQALAGKAIFIRRIPGIDAIDQAIGRAVEMGRPVSFTTGLTGLSPLLYACLGVLQHITRRIARFHSKLIVPANDPEALAVTEAVIQTAYRLENRGSQYDPTTVRFLSSEQFAFASGYVGLIHRENVGSAFLFGSYAAESLILAEAGQRIGALQVAATVSPEQIPFFITACDYTLLGDELYAAGAYLSKEPVQVGSLRGQDIGKFFLIALIVVGVVLATYSTMRSSSLVEKDALPLAKLFSASWQDMLGGDKETVEDR